MLCFRLFSETSPADPLANAVTQLREGQAPKDLYAVEPGSFQQIPNAPFAYWVSEGVRKLFAQLRAFEGDGRTVRQGLATSDDFRFIRAAWETPYKLSRSSGRQWIPFAKGGGFSAFYADVPLVVNWFNDGCELKAWVETLPGCSHWSRRIASAEYYFRPGLTWPLRAYRLCPQAMPQGCIFSVRGYSAQANLEELPVLHSIVASRVFDALFKIMLGRMGYPEFIVGVFQLLPLPDNILPIVRDSLGNHSKAAWSTKRRTDTSTLISRAFHAPALAPGRKPRTL
jgi:hypothetical protein